MMRSTIIGLMLLLMMAAVASSCQKEAPPPKEVIRAIKTIKIEERGRAQTRRFSGVIEPVDKSSLSFEVSGNVKDVLFDVGQEITEGEVIATLDPKTFNLDVDAAQAKLRRSRAQLTEKEAEYARYRKVNEESPGAVSQSSVDQAKAAFESARENVKVAVSELNLVKRDLTKTKLLAPFDGVIATRHVEPFFEVKRGDPIYDVFIEGTMEVVSSIPETDIEGIYIGQRCRIIFPINPTQVYNGIVTDVGRVAGTANAFPVKIKILTMDLKLRPGMTAEVTFAIATADHQRAFLVPISALTAGKASKRGFVFVYDSGTSTVKKVPVRGIRSVEGNRIMVVEGLSGGEVIAVAGVSFLEDGQKVKLLDPTQVKE
ncbi:MAG: efflux RND transporter periplasmic adaptor subunit [Desulfobacterales bacterium]|nr:efflux RND transporter periplasmic adaptor subunit [Desulfobacterales bacterium]